MKKNISVHLVVTEIGVMEKVNVKPVLLKMEGLHVSLRMKMVDVVVEIE